MPTTSPITEFTLDEEGDWCAVLACGHRQHVRHKPPMQSRPWVLTERGRAEHVGVDLACIYCDMPRLPPGASEYKRTKSFEAETTPAGLLRSHQTKEGVWGEIVVTRGHVAYVIESTPPLSVPLRPGQPGVIAPAALHHVVPQTGAAFYVRFLRVDG